MIILDSLTVGSVRQICISSIFSCLVQDLYPCQRDLKYQGSIWPRSMRPGVCFGNFMYSGDFFFNSKRMGEVIQLECVRQKEKRTNYRILAQVYRHVKKLNTQMQKYWPGSQRSVDKMRHTRGRLRNAEHCCGLGHSREM